MKRRKGPPSKDQGALDFESTREERIYADICRNNHGGEYFSENANEGTAPVREIQRGRIIAYFETVKDSTCEEAEKALSLRHQTCSARFSELKRDGMITAVFIQKDQRAYRLTGSGKEAGVYRLVKTEPPTDSGRAQPTPCASTPGAAPQEWREL
jgi:hypothetical protein